MNLMSLGMRMLMGITFVCATWCIYFIEHYFFMEPRHKNWRKYLVILNVCTMITWACGSFLGAFLGVSFLGLGLVLARKEHKIRGFLVMIPAICFWDALTGAVLYTCMYFSGSDSLTGQATKISVALIIMGILCILLDVILSKWELKRGREITLVLKPYEKKILYGITFLIVINYNAITSDLSTSERLISYSKMGLDKLFQLWFSLFVCIIVLVLIYQNSRREMYHRELQKMQHNIILTMAEIVENRDENTGDHIKRTAQYVSILAKKMQQQKAYSDILTDTYVEDMIVAAPLHDMGKIHVPDAILNKPGRLSEEEFDKMKEHTLAGEELLSKAEDNLGEMSYLEIAVLMAGYHHEWWNGSGYPHGAKGEEIPLCARIMAVADVFDALISKRCYKDAMSLEKAYEIMKEETGTHFDPVVMEAFWAAQDEITAAVQEMEQ